MPLSPRSEESTVNAILKVLRAIKENIKESANKNFMDLILN